MFTLYADKSRLTVRGKEPLVSGSVNVYQVQFQFSGDWDGLSRTAVFRAGSDSRSILLDKSGRCTVPWEVLTSHGQNLMTGVSGTGPEGNVVLPTIWANLGMIWEGVSSGESAKPPTPDIWEQELNRKGDSLYYDGLNLSLLSGGKGLSTVQIFGGDGDGGPVYQFGHGLKLNGNTVSVNAVDDFKGDNTLPMTAAGVQTTVGNIEALLGTI